MTPLTPATPTPSTPSTIITPAAGSARTRIVVADDHQIIREGLRSLLGAQADMEVVGEAADGREVLALAEKLHPDVVVMDLSMPVLNGIDATKTLTKEGHVGKVIVLSMHADRQFVARALAAGAAGYVLKDSAFEELAQAIRVIRGGGVYLTPKVASAVAEDYRSDHSGAERAAVLTDREREVLQLLAEGHTTKQVAAELHVSVKTVETHRKRIMDRLNLQSIAELTKYAIREGITSVEL